MLALALLPIVACAHPPSKGPVAASSAPSAPTQSRPQPTERAPAAVPSRPAAAASAPGVASPVAEATGGSAGRAPAAQPSAAIGSAGRLARRGPAIYAATISPSVVHNGEAMTWAVRTTTDVVSVTAHVSVYTLPLHREKSGLFVLSFTVPSDVPGFLHGTYSLDMVAQDTAGTTAKRTVPLVFQ